MRRRSVGSVRASLLAKSREAAMNAVQTFNNPLTTFKTEAFIVLMVIAWTYLLHAYYRKEGIDYRYYKEGPKRHRYDRTKSGSYKYWELERCLNDERCPLDGSTKSNLRFLIGLRHEIEHHMPAGADDQLAGRYFACCLNYERTITDLFRDKYSLGKSLSFSLQFRDLREVPQATEAPKPLPANVAKYIQQFDASLSEEEFQSPHFSYRLLFVPKVTSKRGQADRAIEFIPAASELAKTVDKDYWVLKEVERRKYRPSGIVKMMNAEGYHRFNMHHHTELWKKLNAKNIGKGYGTDAVPGQWLWYEPWVVIVRQHCKDNAADYTQTEVGGG